jgi:integrase
LAEATVAGKLECLRNLAKRVDLWDSQAVEDVVRETANWGNAYKNRVLYAYQDWLLFHGFEYKFEPYCVNSKLPYVPLEKDIDQLIYGFAVSKAKRYAAMLQLAKETGWRPVEIFRLTPADFDLERQIVTLNDPAKRSEPRQVKMSDKLVAMMKPLLADTPFNARVWSSKPKKIRRTFTEEVRNRIADKLGALNLRKITLKTFRNFKGTMTYYKTKDIVYTQRVLGHKNIKNTLVYIHLVNFDSDEYVAKVATNLEEACQLIEAGFEYVTEMDGAKIFRKRK